jgi:hypothetical protein
MRFVQTIAILLASPIAAWRSFSARRRLRAIARRDRTGPLTLHRVA